MWVRTAASYAHSSKSFLANLRVRLTTGNTTTSSCSFSTRKSNAEQLGYAWSQWARLESFFQTGQVYLCPKIRPCVHLKDTFHSGLCGAFHSGLCNRWRKRYGDPKARGKAGRNFLEVACTQLSTILCHFLNVCLQFTVEPQHCIGLTCAKKCI